MHKYMYMYLCNDVCNKNLMCAHHITSNNLLRNMSHMHICISIENYESMLWVMAVCTPTTHLNVTIQIIDKLDGDLRFAYPHHHLNIK